LSPQLRQATGTPTGFVTVRTGGSTRTGAAKASLGASVDLVTVCTGGSTRAVVAMASKGATPSRPMHSLETSLEVINILHKNRQTYIK
jgi:hypothetical protein